MAFQLDANIYNRANADRRADEALRLRKQQIATNNQFAREKLDADRAMANRKLDLSERLMGLREQKFGTESILGAERVKSEKMERAAKYLGMATAENWPVIRQQAISEGLGDETTIPVQFDENWLASTKESLLGVKPSAMPADVRTFEYYDSLSPEKQDVWDNTFGGKNKPSAMEQKTNALIESGVPEEIATGIVTGRYVTSRHPVTQAATVIDKATGQPVEYSAPTASAPAPTASAPAPTSGGPTGLFLAVPKGSGVESTLTALGSNVAGQFDSDYVAKDTIDARTQLNAFQKVLQRAMSVNPERPLKFDLEQTQEMFSGATSKAPGVVEQELKTLRNSILTQRDLDIADSKNGSLPPKVRQEAMARVAALNQALEIMGTPGDTPPVSSRVKEMSDEELLRELGM